MLQKQFDEITKWQDLTFPGATVLSKLIHLAGDNPTEKLGEIGELIRAINDEDHTIDYGKMRSVKMEFADCFLLLFGAAAKYGMSYAEICNAIQEKFEINQARKWGSPDSNGVVNHIK